MSMEILETEWNSYLWFDWGLCVGKEQLSLIYLEVPGAICSQVLGHEQVLLVLGSLHSRGSGLWSRFSGPCTLPHAEMD